MTKYFSKIKMWSVEGNMNEMQENIAGVKKTGKEVVESRGSM